MKQIMPVSDSRVQFLRELIARSKDVYDFTKKALIFLVDQSENLSKPVHMCIVDEKIGEEIAEGVREMINDKGNTKLNFYLKKMGTPMMFSAHCGRYADTPCAHPAREEGKPCPVCGGPYRRLFTGIGGYTIWIAPGNYGQGKTEGTEEVEFDQSVIDAVALPS